MITRTYSGTIQILSSKDASEYLNNSDISIFAVVISLDAANGGLTPFNTKIYLVGGTVKSKYDKRCSHSDRSLSSRHIYTRIFASTNILNAACLLLETVREHPSGWCTG